MYQANREHHREVGQAQVDRENIFAELFQISLVHYLCNLKRKVQAKRANHFPFLAGE
jgi:hypothetical protein